MEKLINKKKLDLACGQNRQTGFFGIDKVLIKGKVDAAMDLQIYPWAVKTGSVEEVFCAHYLEHIPHSTFEEYAIKATAECKSWGEYQERIAQFVPNDGLVKFFNELSRIMKKGASAKFICPYETSIRAWQDPTHVRAINEASLLYLNKEWRTLNALDHMGLECDFDYGFGHDLTPEWQNKVQDQKDYGIRHLHNVAADIHFMVTKR